MEDAKLTLPFLNKKEKGKNANRKSLGEEDNKKSPAWKQRSFPEGSSLGQGIMSDQAEEGFSFGAYKNSRGKGTSSFV
jgi:hypothetical protein